MSDTTTTTPATPDIDIAVNAEINALERWAEKVSHASVEAVLTKARNERRQRFTDPATGILLVPEDKLREAELSDARAHDRLAVGLTRAQSTSVNTVERELNAAIERAKEPLDPVAAVLTSVGSKLTPTDRLMGRLVARMEAEDMRAWIGRHTAAQIAERYLTTDDPLFQGEVERVRAAGFPPIAGDAEGATKLADAIRAKRESRPSPELRDLAAKLAAARRRFDLSADAILHAGVTAAVVR